MAKLGDRVGFMLGNKPRPGDIRSLSKVRQDQIELIETFADVIGVGEGDALNLIVWTEYGHQVIRGIVADQTKTTPETWHDLSSSGESD